MLFDNVDEEWQGRIFSHTILGRQFGLIRIVTCCGTTSARKHPKSHLKKGIALACEALYVRNERRQTGVRVRELGLLPAERVCARHVHHVRVPSQSANNEILVRGDGNVGVGTRHGVD